MFLENVKVIIIKIKNRINIFKILKKKFKIYRYSKRQKVKKICKEEKYLG